MPMAIKKSKSKKSRTYEDSNMSRMKTPLFSTQSFQLFAEVRPRGLT